MASSGDYLSRFEDSREFLAAVEAAASDAIYRARDMEPAEAAPVFAQVALAKAIAGLAAAIRAHTQR